MLDDLVRFPANRISLEYICTKEKWNKKYGSNDFQDYFDDAKESRVKHVRQNQASRTKSQRIKIQEQLSFKIQDSRTIKIKIQDSRFKIQDSREVDFKIQEKKSRSNSQDFTREVFFKNPNITQFCFTKEFSQNFSKLPEYLLSGN